VAVIRAYRRWTLAQLELLLAQLEDRFQRRASMDIAHL
jgi:hypothetical protein